MILANPSFKTHRRDQLVGLLLISSVHAVLANTGPDRMDQGTPCGTICTFVSTDRIIWARWNPWH